MTSEIDPLNNPPPGSRSRHTTSLSRQTNHASHPIADASRRSTRSGIDPLPRPDGTDHVTRGQ